MIVNFDSRSVVGCCCSWCSRGCQLLHIDVLQFVLCFKLYKLQHIYPVDIGIPTATSPTLDIAALCLARVQQRSSLMIRFSIQTLASGYMSAYSRLTIVK